jgi:hypothetical protein
LHRSDQNKSPYPRWSRRYCCDTWRNNPRKTSHRPCCEPLVKAQESVLKEMDVILFSKSSEFLNSASGTAMEHPQQRR